MRLRNAPLRVRHCSGPGLSTYAQQAPRPGLGREGPTAGLGVFSRQGAADYALAPQGWQRFRRSRQGSDRPADVREQARSGPELVFSAGGTPVGPPAGSSPEGPSLRRRRERRRLHNVLQGIRPGRCNTCQLPIHSDPGWFRPPVPVPVLLLLFSIYRDHAEHPGLQSAAASQPSCGDAAWVKGPSGCPLILQWTRPCHPEPFRPPRSP
jgi:hypothetical protein